MQKRLVGDGKHCVHNVFLVLGSEEKALRGVVRAWFSEKLPESVLLGLRGELKAKSNYSL
jgi:hypothetical protein